MTEVLKQDCVTMTCAPTREARLSVLKVDMTRSPTPAEVDVWVAAIDTFVRGHEGRLALHVGFVGPPVAAPDTATWLAIVAPLLQMDAAVESKFKGCVVEVRGVTDAVRAVQALFESMYQPKKPLYVVGTPADADAEIERLVLRAEAKRQRQAASKALAG